MRTRRGYRTMGRRLGVSLWVLAALSAGATSVRGPVERPVAWRHVVVSGDTLWALAGRTEAPRVDRRELVWMLKQVNGLPGAILYPGQVVLIPVGRESVKLAVRRPAGFRAAAEIRTEPSTSPCP